MELMNPGLLYYHGDSAIANMEQVKPKTNNQSPKAYRSQVNLSKAEPKSAAQSLCAHYLSMVFLFFLFCLFACFCFVLSVF